MRNSLRFLSPVTFTFGLILMSLSMLHPASANPAAQSHGVWISLETQPSFPPGVEPMAQSLVNTLNKEGGADSAVYVPELHRLFAHYSR